MEKSLRQMIVNELDLNYGLATKLAEMSGYSTGGNFRKILQDESKDIEKIDGFIKVVQYLFPSDYQQLLVRFAMQLNPDRLTCRLLLEYATLHHLYYIKRILLNKMKSSTKQETMDWYFVYSTDDDIAMGNLPLCEGIDTLFSRTVKKVEARVYQRIAQIYCYYDMRNIHMIDCALPQIEHELKLIKNPFLRNAYEGRIFRIKVDINLHTDKLAQVLSSGFQLENAHDPTKSAVYLQIGNSYIMKDYNKAVKYFNLALEYANQKTENEIRQSMNFAAIYWDKLDAYISDGTESNELFYQIKLNNREQAMEILEYTDIEALTEHQKGFHWYYRSLLFNDVSMLYKSIEHFKKAGERLFIQIPIKALKSVGVKEYVLKALSA
ncbi:AimR family lysis-lysogeny pheromone receptor [Bacillus infantis]|uniref:Tetratricopeptide repeat protein n=1 Tax=Bacillus infantis TaxID=324767 RepID=A0A5D4RA70_9BACI|nr:AimR family lysis-lysogeny pheromone receptor [Bacillus infantis]TYS46746.1 hypothetical protein FZD51_14840 [Bacillus infantis]